MRGHDNMEKRSYVMEEYPKEFMELWNEYPRKEGKKLAVKYYKKLLKDYVHEQIKKAMYMYLDDKKGTDIKYIKQGKGFFAETVHDYIDAEADTKSEPQVVYEEVKISDEFENQYQNVLMQLTIMDYNQYLNTDHWNHFKEQCIIHANNKCQLCNETM